MTSSKKDPPGKQTRHPSAISGADEGKDTRINASQNLTSLLVGVDDEIEQMRERMRKILTDDAHHHLPAHSSQVLEELVVSLRLANEHLVISSLTANTRETKAAEVHQRQTEFLSMLAHELRNPLAPITTSVELMGRMTGLSPELKSLQRILARQTTHLTRLVEDLMDATRISGAKITLRKTTVLLSQLIGQAIETSQPLLDKHQQQVFLALPEAPVWIDGDSIRLVQLFSNLIINASKFSADLCPVFVSARCEADNVIVSVKDEGVADGIFWISQVVHRDSMARKIQVVKMRGQAQKLGLHTFRIGAKGIEIFPRTLFGLGATPVSGDQRLSLGVPALDHMMGGGLPAAYSMLLVGPSGSGKTVLATQFLAEGVRVGEPGVIAAFEKSPNQLLSHELNQMITQGEVGLIDTRALDLSIDEILHDLMAMIRRMGAKRVVIDSLSGFEVALASVFRENFRESLYRLVAVLTGMGVTVVMTSELEDSYTDLRFSTYGNAFLADAIVMQRYVEIQGQLKRVISVVKVRASAHSKDIRFYDVVQGKLEIANDAVLFNSILAGHPLNPSL